MRKKKISFILKSKNGVGIRRFRRIELCISGSLTVIIGIFTIVYTIQQHKIDESGRKQDLIAAQIKHEQNVYDEYISDLSQRLLDLSEKEIIQWEEYKQHIRIKTLNAFPQINLNQRKNILFFLYDNQLIRSDLISNSIDLTGADLSYLKFSNPCYLVNISLRNLIANSIEFNGCNIEYADFTGSTMIGAKFLNTRMGAAKFFQSNLTDASFINSNRAGLWLHNAILVRSTFIFPPQNMRFMNADLYLNDWTIEDIVNHTFDQQYNSVVNTRFPDGTFSRIDPKQLIVDNGAEQGCGKDVDTYLYNEPRPIWRQDFRYSNIYLVNKSEILINPNEGDCYFKCTFNKSRLEQAIYVRNYSLLIDHQKAFYNLSAFFICPFHIGQVYIEISFYTDTLISAGGTNGFIIFNKTQENEKIFTFLSIEGHIPEYTRFIYVEIGAKQIIGYESLYCLVDNIQLYIYKKET